MTNGWGQPSPGSAVSARALAAARERGADGSGDGGTLIRLKAHAPAACYDHDMLATIPAEKIYDARNIPCETKQPQVFARARGLADGDFFVLVNGHNPLPLRYLLESAYPGQFVWDNLQQDPGNFAVRISRKNA